MYEVCFYNIVSLIILQKNHAIQLLLKLPSILYFFKQDNFFILNLPKEQEL
jgi:hypothetical protein